mgnify:CR=1 FL=1
MLATRSDPRQTARWRALRARLYERDRAVDAPCWICGQPIDYRAPAGTPDAWEPDHVAPVSSDPDKAYDPGNIRPAHSSCNRSRGSSKGAPSIGEPSRNW